MEVEGWMGSPCLQALLEGLLSRRHWIWSPHLSMILLAWVMLSPLFIWSWLGHSSRVPRRVECRFGGALHNLASLQLSFLDSLLRAPSGNGAACTPHDLISKVVTAFLPLILLLLSQCLKFHFGCAVLAVGFDLVLKKSQLPFQVQSLQNTFIHFISFHLHNSPSKPASDIVSFWGRERQRKDYDLGSGYAGFESQLYHSFTVWPWTGSSMALNLIYFPTCTGFKLCFTEWS